MNESLKKKKWKTFKIKDLFTVKNAKAHHRVNLKEDDNGIPYITRTANNNGIQSFIKDEEGLSKIPKNTISFGAETVKFFYHEYEYITGNKMYYVKMDGLNKYIALFLVSVFENNFKNEHFGYGLGLTGTRFKNKNILLPVNSEEKPDWEFIERFMINIEKEILPEKDFKPHNITDNRELEFCLVIHPVYAYE